MARGALQRSQADLERAKGDIKTLLEKLDAATSKVGDSYMYPISPCC